MIAIIYSRVVVRDFLDTSPNETLNQSDSGIGAGMPLLTVVVTHGALYPPLLDRVSLSPQIVFLAGEFG
jgi:hypothetical protein